MTKTYAEIASDMNIEDIMAIHRKTDESINKKPIKLDFGLFEELYNEFGLILESLETLCRGFIEADEKLISGLPDLALVNISHGQDAMKRIWDKAVEEQITIQKMKEAPVTEPSHKDSTGA